MTLDSIALRTTMRHWVTGVTIVTTVAGGERAGMTVSSFTSVSLDPPTVLVCLNKDTYAQSLVMKSGVYAISLLGTGQEVLSNRFAGFDPTVTDRFAGLDCPTADTGSPFIPGAIGWLDCRVKAAHDAFTHTIFVAEVVYAHVNEERPPLVYFNRKYQLLVAVEDSKA